MRIKWDQGCESALKKIKCTLSWKVIVTAISSFETLIVFMLQVEGWLANFYIFVVLYWKFCKEFSQSFSNVSPLHSFSCCSQVGHSWSFGLVLCFRGGEKNDQGSSEISLGKGEEWTTAWIGGSGNGFFHHQFFLEKYAWWGKTGLDTIFFGKR